MPEKESAPKKRVPGTHRRKTGALWHESSNKKPTRAGRKTRAQKFENVELSRKGGRKFYGPGFSE